MSDFHETNLPEKYQPLSAWAYFWLSILYTIPLIGFICWLVHVIDSSNINRRNFAASYLCGLAIAAIVIVVMLILGGGTFIAAYFEEILAYIQSI